MFGRWLAVGLLLAAGLFQRVAAAEILPVDAFSTLPLVQAPRLSPDGNRIAYLANVEDRTALVSVDLATGKSTVVATTDNRKFRFLWQRWIGDEHLLFGAIYPDQRYGTRTSETRLLSAKVGSADSLRVLVAPRSVTSNDHFAQLHDRVIGTMPEEPRRVLVSVDLDEPTYHSVYAVDVDTGAKRRVLRARPPVRNWIADQQGRVRVGIAYEQRSGKAHTTIHRLADDKWVSAWERELQGPPPVEPLGFGLDPDQLYVRAYHQGRAAIFTVNTADPALPMQLVAHDERYDIEGALIHSEKNGEVIGVHHSEDSVSRIYWHPGYRELQAEIDKVLPSTTNTIISTSADEGRYLLSLSSASQPPAFYIGDRASGELVPVLEAYPQLQGRLGGNQKVSYKARDGQMIEAYLTLPTGYRPESGPLPAVVFPHGGPMARDYGGFDEWAAFFASRGLAVLQPNFRGSSGYGWEFEMAAIQNYGGTMQDDLTDAARWLIEQRIALPDRIGIVGASYGGYAALMGAVKTPELFRCAISFAGIGNLIELRDHYRNFINYKVAKVQFGEDNKQLKSVSPYYHAERVRIPVLLAHGDADRVVPVEQSRDMAKALRKSGKAVTYLELEDGSHNLDLQQHRQQFFQAMDVFLHEHLLAGAETVAAGR